MLRHLTVVGTLLLSAGVSYGPAFSQDATTDAAATDAAGNEADLLTAAELQNLVAPVALFPDTLLIQILIAATQPFDVMKADRLLLENAGASLDVLKPLIRAEGYDPSVAVLAEGFPDVLHRMADHIDWTETVGDAMLVQSDDVLAAVQVMRTQALNTGALATTEQQVVTKSTSDNTVVIQPADPAVVYVPQYDPQVIYDPGFTAGDAITAGLITWGTIAIIDEIFDDDDDWNDYWGCRNCAGWGGAPIIRNPDIDIDVDGNVNIGNDISFDRDTIRNGISTGDIKIKDNDLRARFEAGDISNTELRSKINSGEIEIGDKELRGRLEGGDKAGWAPEAGRRDEARTNLQAKRDTGATPVTRPQIGGADELSAKLSGQGRVTDRAGLGASAGTLAQRPGGADRDLSKIKERTPSAKPLAAPKAKSKPEAKRSVPQKTKPAPKIAKKSDGRTAKAASQRGTRARR